MDAACIAWDTAFLLPVLLSLSSSFPLFQPAPPFLPSCPWLRCVFVPPGGCPASVVSAAAVLLCCLLCLVVPALLRARVGFLCAFSPRLPPLPFFVRPACCVLPLLVLCLCCVVLRFPVVCCGWLSLFPSLLSPPPACVCVCQHWQTFSQQIYSDYTDQWTSDKVLKVKRKFQHFVISCFASSVDDSVLWQSHLLDEVHPDWQMFLYKNTESFEQFLH